MRDFVITSESVTAGHPDKLCDQISDAVVDAYLAAGVRAGVVAECALASGVAFLSVRAGAEAPVDLAALARRVIAEAGYNAGGPGRAPTVMLDLSHAAEMADVAAAPMRARHMVSAFGYACGQTGTQMPYPIWAAHRLTAAMDAARREGRLDWLVPDGQAQVAVGFADRRPVTLRAIALTFGVAGERDDAQLEQELLDRVVRPALAGQGPEMTGETRLVLAPVRGPTGPAAHSGLTGRKAADDAYGSFIRRSGAALSGKDPSRIDRIAAYAARQAARALVTAGLAGECEVQLSYIVGDEGPASVEVDSYGSGAVPDARLSVRLREVMDFRVGAIVEAMDLWGLPGARDGRFYRDLATYGHLGRDELSPPWEDMALARALA
ncbi:MAG: methionine adenosyltransferase domain-containing protein [Paracoccaceae bacterium]